MNDTQDLGGTTAAPPPPPAADRGSRVTGEQVRDLNRLRRSRTDHKLAGVAGGLGRHLDIDPTLLRVAFVVLCFFGGAGVLLYVALWLLVPEDGQSRAAIATGEETRKILLIAAAVLAVVFIFGQGWSGWWFGPGVPLGVLAVGVVVFLVSRDQRRRPGPAAGATSLPDPPAGATAPLPTSPPTGPYAGSFQQTGTSEVPPPSRPRWAPPPYVAPPPRPRRNGLLLFWPTLALIAIALGILGIYDSNGHVVDQAAYPALALAVTGAMLVLGAFVGRPGGLILVGCLCAATLVVVNVIGSFALSRTINHVPGRAGDVASSYDFHNGQLTLDLSQVSDLPDLDGRTVRVHGGTGRIEVIVPRDLAVHVDSSIRVVGGTYLGDDYARSGFAPTATTTLGDPNGDPTLQLDLDLRVGEIDVRQP